MSPRFDLALFTELNDEYESKPLVPKPRTFDPAARAREADQRTQRLDRRLDLRGKRVLEIGCGAGTVGRQLAERLDCTVVGIDIDEHEKWAEGESQRVSYVVGDISDPPELGRFDAMFSFSVWEHIVHPQTALAKCFDLLNPGGRMFLQAQLHRGPKASHRYREIFFPWPHLLFTPEVFEEYYVATGREPKRPAWVNALTSEQYVAAIERTGYVSRARRTPVTSKFDEAFYQRFHEQLAVYPRRDLSHDVFTTVIERPLPTSIAETAATPPPAVDEVVAADEAPVEPPPSTAQRAWRRVPAPVRDHRAVQAVLTAARRRLTRASPA